MRHRARPPATRVFGFVFLVLAMGLAGPPAMLFYPLGIGCFIAAIALNLRAGRPRKEPE